jgi:type IV pilus assembly protein PilY1
MDYTHKTTRLSFLAISFLSYSAISYATSPITLSQKPLFITTGEPANVLVILDNSNSMDEAANGYAVGGADPQSKSVIARRAVIDLISKYSGKINMGLMAYQQNPMVRYNLHPMSFDASFDSSNYNHDFIGPRDSITKRFQTPNVSNPSTFVNYNINLPLYGGGSLGTAYCYSRTGDFNNADADKNQAPDVYRCFRQKLTASDPAQDEIDAMWGNTTLEAAAGFESYWRNISLRPTDSDKAQGLFEWGQFISWDWVGLTWFGNSSPGKGYLHVPIRYLNDSQADDINIKLGKTSAINEADWGKSQFVDNYPTHPSYPLQNAGLTPLEGTLLSAKTYFSNPASLSDAEGGGGANADDLPESCGKDFIALLTDGLPSTTPSGGDISDTDTALAEVANAAASLNTDGVETYTIGFALPLGTASGALDSIAAAGGTGAAYLADDPATLQATFDTVFKDILVKAGASSSAASNSTSLTSSSVLYQARFNPDNNWSGDLLANALSYVVSGAALTVTVNPAETWSAADQLETKGPDNRVILTYARDTSTAIGGLPFRWSDIESLGDDSVKNALNTKPITLGNDGKGSDRVDYLRGGTGGSSANSFRADRAAKLGSIIHSSPVYVGLSNAGYSDPDYQSFIDASGARATRPAILYAGANDGMLHGFSADSGNEVIAYVPGEVLPNINLLTADGYGTSVPHRYFVDGTPMVADVKLEIGSTTSWKTILAGGLNGGGQGIYALDVTNPLSFSESNADKLALWEFTDEDDADLGYTYLQPTVDPSTKQSAQIVKMANDKWAVIVGNGYNNTDADGHASATGHAALFILFIEEGIDGHWSSTGDYIKLDTGIGTTLLPNGLATPAPFDRDNDGRVDYIYAGDLLGNLWKFDVSSTSTRDWGNKISGNSPLFTASFTDSSSIITPQPITTIPIIAAHPTEGYLIGFGTGKYIEHSDITDTSEQAFYGIWDKNSSNPHTIDKSDLVQQTIDFTSPSGTFPRYRLTSNHEVDYDDKLGWYMELSEAGERISVNPVLRPGRFVFVTRTPRESLTPCDPGGGTSWLMELDYLTGSPLPISPLDLNGDGVVDDNDKITVTDAEGNPIQVAISGVQSGDGMLSSPTVLAHDDIKKDSVEGYGHGESKVFTTTNGGTVIQGESTPVPPRPDPDPEPTPGNPGHRVSWEEIR